MTETPFESPAEDVAEQHAEVQPDADGEPLETGRRAEISWDADPTDALEQEVEVPIDEDEWR